MAAGEFSVSFISAVERGQIYPTLKSLEKFAARLQVSVTELLTPANHPIQPIDDEFGLGAGAGAVAAVEPTGAPVWEFIETEVYSAQVLILRGEAGAAVERLLLARARAFVAQQQALVDWCLASAYVALGRGDLAQQTAAGALVVAVRSGAVELAARLRIGLAQAAAQAGDHVLARDLLLEGIAGIVPADPGNPGNPGNQSRPSAEGWRADPMDAAALHAAVAAEYEQLGDMERAIGHLQEAARRATESAQPEQRGAADWLLSQQHASAGNLRWAWIYARRSLAAFEAAGIQRRATAAQVLLGRALARVGQDEAGLMQLYQARALADMRRDHESLAEITLALALLLLERQRVDEAEQAAMESVTYAIGMDNPGLEVRTLLALARVQEARGDLDAADASYRQAIEVARAADEERGASPNEAAGGESPRGSRRRAPVADLRAVYVAYAELLERRGEAAQALAMLKQALAMLKQALAMLKLDIEHDEHYR
jgi:tetratricopeptide (TPR) repeat protein